MDKYIKCMMPVQRDDELGRLAIAINELSQEISRSEKMQSEFISSISHELRVKILVPCRAEINFLTFKQH